VYIFGILRRRMPKDSQSPDAEENAKRHFNYVSSSGDISGRYSGRKPKQAANKVYSALWRERKTNNKSVTGKIKFAIRECTRGSRHKTYYYVGIREKLDTPTKVPIQSGGGETKIVKYFYSNNVMKDREATQAANAKAEKVAKEARKVKGSTKNKKSGASKKKAVSAKAKSSKPKPSKAKSESKAKSSKKKSKSKGKK
jgi:Non-histone chromosomal protein MC1